MSLLLVGTEDGLWQEDRRLLNGHVVAVAPTGTGGWVAIVEGRLVRGAGADVDGAAVVGTAEAHLVRADGRDAWILESFEAAEGRAGWYTPWGGPPDTRSLAVAGDGTLYVNVHVGGIVRSDDGGETWRPTIDVDADVHQVVVAGDRVVAATAYGLATSTDRGATWTFSTDGLHGAYARAVAVAGDWLLLSASTGPSTDRAAVYRRPLDAGDGVPFERCTDWFGANIDTGLLTAARDGTSVALAGPHRHLAVSSDAGASWARAESAPAGITSLAWVG